MKRPFLLLLSLTLLAPAVFAGNRITEEFDPSNSARNKAVKHAKVAEPMKLSPAEADTLKLMIEKDRNQTQDWLKTSATSYLAAIARRDFGNQRAVTIGSDLSDDPRIADSTVAAHALRVTVDGDSFLVETSQPRTTFTVQGEEQHRAVLAPGAIGLGRFSLRLSHQRYPAIIVFDPQSKRFAEYKGLKWYPVDMNCRFRLPMVPNPDPDTLLVLSTHSQARRAIRAGWFVFKLDGKRCVLEATRLLEPGVGENDVSVFFRDKTTGKDTYEVGRYVDPERQPDGTFVLDFNTAYNPACAISPYYNCPIPGKANKLDVAVKAGEMNSHYQH
jgi:uncharacterized protein (DUF1684 family)